MRNLVKAGVRQLAGYRRSMNFDFILVLTYSRSGSTLLQGILNSIDGVLVRGENATALTPIHSSYLRAQTARAGFGQGSASPTSAWFGAADIQVEEFGRALGRAFVEHVLRPQQDTRMIGYKEIRHILEMSDEELMAFMAFVRSVFGRSGFIINTRSIQSVITSAERAKHGVTPEQLIAADQRLRVLADSGAPDIFHVHYDDYVADPDKLQPLFEFLGAPYRPDRLRRVLATPHSV